MVVIAAFSTTGILPPQSYAQTVLNLPIPGTMVSPSTAFIPVTLRGLSLHPENPLKFDFLVDNGHTGLQGDELNFESTRLIKYFLASLTTPSDEMWVNLSPYEQDRIIPKEFGFTEMGRDLLAQDYLLKQLTASLIYPEQGLGKEFWERVRAKAREQFGTDDIPVSTFNKVWIVPEKAVVYENGNTAFVLENRLKVMLEEHYLASQNQSGKSGKVVSGKPEDTVTTSTTLPLTTDILREIIIPELEREVNEGRHFANLRQICNALVLATWFKRNLKESVLGKVYMDQHKVSGVDVDDRAIKEKIYQQYLEAYKKGVYNYIKEDYDPVSKQLIPRKYFSGGFENKYEEILETVGPRDPAMAARMEEVQEEFAGPTSRHLSRVGTNLNPKTEPFERSVVERISISSKKDLAMTAADDSANAMPTDSILASEGLKHFKELVDRLTPDLIIFVTNSYPQMLALYTGVRPEVGGVNGSVIDRVPEEARARLIKAIESNINYVVIEDPKGGYSIINLIAAQRVIDSNPNYFPRGVKSREWLKRDPREWRVIKEIADPHGDIQQIRYGLLSGFPPQAAVRFPEFARAKIKIHDLFGGLSEFERESVAAYLEGPQENRTTDQREAVRSALQRVGLSASEAELLVNGELMGSWAGKFWGFSESDRLWNQELEKIYTETLHAWQEISGNLPKPQGSADSAMLAEERSASLLESPEADVESSVGVAASPPHLRLVSTSGQEESSGGWLTADQERQLHTLAKVLEADEAPLDYSNILDMVKIIVPAFRQDNKKGQALVLLAKLFEDYDEAGAARKVRDSISLFAPESFSAAYRKEVAQRLREALPEHGQKAEAARGMGLQPTYLGELIQEGRGSLKSYLLLANYLRKPISWILFGIDDRRPFQYYNVSLLDAEFANSPLLKTFVDLVRRSQSDPEKFLGREKQAELLAAAAQRIERNNNLTEKEALSVVEELMSGVIHQGSEAALQRLSVFLRGNGYDRAADKVDNLRRALPAYAGEFPAEVKSPVKAPVVPTERIPEPEAEIVLDPDLITGLLDGSLTVAPGYRDLEVIKILGAVFGEGGIEHQKLGKLSDAILELLEEWLVSHRPLPEVLKEVSSNGYGITDPRALFETAVSSLMKHRLIQTQKGSIRITPERFQADRRRPSASADEAMAGLSFVDLNAAPLGIPYEEMTYKKLGDLILSNLEKVLELIPPFPWEEVSLSTVRQVQPGTYALSERPKSSWLKEISQFDDGEIAVFLINHKWFIHISSEVPFSLPLLLYVLQDKNAFQFLGHNHSGSHPSVYQPSDQDAKAISTLNGFEYIFSDIGLVEYHWPDALPGGHRSHAAAWKYWITEKLKLTENEYEKIGPVELKRQYFEKFFGLKIIPWTDITEINRIFEAAEDSAVVSSFDPAMMGNGGESLNERRRTNDEGRTTKDLGGIDLNANDLDIEIRGEGPGIQLPVNLQGIAPQNIHGFTPNIIYIETIPINTLPMILGMADSKDSVRVSRLE